MIKLRMKLGFGLIVLLPCLGFSKGRASEDVLVKLAPGVAINQVLNEMPKSSARAEQLTEQWVRLQTSTKHSHLLKSLSQSSAVEIVQPNFFIHLQNDTRIQDNLRRAAFHKSLRRRGFRSEERLDNLQIPEALLAPLVPDVEKKNSRETEMIVAVIDTGVDYTHADLIPNLWRNKGEIPNNNIDDDNNGYVDDAIGWDFVSDDNQPYDLTADPFELLIFGGNPGNGTHSAGLIAASGQNTFGFKGIAPGAKVMALRVLSEKGSGRTSNAIQAIKYAVDNKAKIISITWSADEDESGNIALHEMLQYAQDHGVLVVAAAANDETATGSLAEYDHDNILGVATSGTSVLSTVVGSQFSDKAIDFEGFQINWDGTTVTSPQVAGAAALYWSTHLEKTWQEVKAALLSGNLFN